MIRLREVPRSPKWRAVRRRWLKDHPTCAACGRRLFRQVHHKVPVHIDPSRELDPTNLITLCEIPKVNHHLNVGHLGDWTRYNSNVVADAAAILKEHT